jgi:aryl-phospho-beta-D-glucosidase BglC (GH1 family)
MLKSKRLIRYIPVVLLILLITALSTSCSSRNNTANTTNSTTTAGSTASDAAGNQSQSTSAQESKPGLTLEVKPGNTWENSGKKYSQYEVVINNDNSVEASGWSVEIPVSSSTKVDQIWNAKYNLENEKLIFKAAEYNDKIAPNGNISFGCILIDAGSINSASARLDCKVNDQMASTVGQGSENSQSTSQTDNNPSNNSNTAGSTQYTQPAKENAKGVPPPTTDDWLHTDGRRILDKNGKEVWLTGVNWFGYNTGTNVFDGLWAADLNTSLAAIADRGFNLLRIPISSELILQWASGKAPDANFNQTTNSYLVGKDSLQIFDYVVGQCRANGIKIMIDIHSAKTDSMGHMKPVWYDGDISEQDFLDSLSWMAQRYKSDDTIIAFDLKNEPHGKPNETPRAIWNDSKDKNNWKYVAEKAANAVLAQNPNVLIVVEGIEIYPKNIKTNSNYASTKSEDYYFNWWGGNLRGVKDYPIDLGKHQDKLVYSPHDYGPSVYEQPWFKNGYTYDSLYRDCWKDNWMFIYEKNIAPLLIGEWGGFMKEPNLTWMTHLRKLIKDKKLNHTFWCFNSNSGDTGGLVLGDFVTWDEEKYKFVKEVLWQKGGKFVGLDHKIPLGKNGISLSDY